MDTPGYSAFRALAAGNGLVPVYRSLAADCLTPVMAHLATAARSRRAFLLESIEGGERIARYSFLGRDPWITLSARDGLVVEREGDRVRRWRGDLLDRVRELLFGLNPARLAGLPRFTGGAVGYLAYDAVRGFERLPGPRRPSGSLEPARRKRRTAPDAPPSVPDAWFGLFDTVLAFDHLRHRILLITSVVPDRDRRPLRRQYAAAGERLDRLARDLSRGLRLAPGMRPEPVTSMDGGLTPQAPEGGLSRRRYAGMVRRAQERIRAGDIYQVVLSQSFKRRLAGDPFAVYRALRRINPSPYMYFLRDGRVCLAGASPEMLVRVEDRRVELHPIAGTRPRGSGPEEDAALEAELRADAKEKAEHVMLVDLGRNDLGRVCAAGSVTVPEFMTVQRFSHVMHLVSRVTGTLAAGRDAFDSLRAAFPAGTVSGAPKIRAMQIIDELEASPRGLYAGAVCYVDYSGNLDSCIIIRTMVSRGRSAWVQAGGGIVADSDPAREHQETINKARAVLTAIEQAGRRVR